MQPPLVVKRLGECLAGAVMWGVSWPGVRCYMMGSGSGGSAGVRRQYGHMHWGYASMQPGVSQEAASTYCWGDHSSHAILLQPHALCQLYAYKRGWDEV